MAYLDLDELPELFDGRLLWSARRAAVAWFRRADHLGDPARPLAESVRSLVAERTGRRPEGPIRLLTHLRYFGHCFNPVSFYYCYAPGGERVEAVIADVTNTPWGESHAYVMDLRVPGARAEHGGAVVLRGSFSKQLHVSPLMGMGHTYDWRLTEPATRLSVHIESTATAVGAAEPGPIFDATLSLSRREATGAELARALTRYPFLTARILARIYSHALRLRVRGAAYHPHPDRAPSRSHPITGHPPMRGAGK
jgi:DUF1365 family protein